MDSHRDDDQANELRQLFEDIEREQQEEEDIQKDEQEIDVLNLPPRREVHTHKKRMKFKISRPAIRLTLIAIIVLICLIAALYIWEGEISSLLHRL